MLDLSLHRTTAAPRNLALIRRAGGQQEGPNGLPKSSWLCLYILSIGNNAASNMHNKHPSLG